MSEYIATGVTYVICAFSLWRSTRRSSARLVRFQWRKPYWIPLRLLALVLAFHGAFALLGVHPAVGLPSLAFLALISFLDLSGILMTAIAALGRLFYEWTFWFPSRRQLVLRSRLPVIREHGNELLGVEAVTVSDLKPSGIISLHGRIRDARSEFGFIAKGERVLIKSVGDFELTVRKLDPPPGGADAEVAPVFISEGPVGPPSVS